MFLIGGLEIFYIMPKTREQKSEQIKQLTDKLKANSTIVIAEFTGLSMDDLTTFRRKAREKGVFFNIVKNTLFTKAAKDAGIKGFDVNKISKQLAIATGDADEATVSKLVYEFAKSSNEKVKIYSGILENKVVPVETIIKLAQLPSREELLAKVVGSLSAPINGFVRVLNGPLQGFYNIAKALSEK